MEAGTEVILEASSRATGRPRAIETIVRGGAAVAILDAANAVVFWHLYRVE